MAFSNATINLTTPPDNTAAGLGDDRIRELKLDLKERLESFFLNWNVDPIVPKAGSIPPAALQAGALPLTVTITEGAQIANDIINTLHLMNLTVSAAKLAADAVTTSKILNDNVTEPKLGPGAVSTRTLADLAVGTTKLADLAVTDAKTADATLTAPKLADSLRIGLTRMFAGTRVVAAADASIAATSVREYDVNVPGAVVGCHCRAEYAAEDGWPTIAGSAAVTANTATVGRDRIIMHAHCVVAGIVRVRCVNAHANATEAIQRNLSAWAFIPFA